MTEQEYKKYTALYFISGLLGLAFMFITIFSAASMETFAVTAKFVIYAVITLISTGWFAGFLVWSFTNKKGREYWTVYFEKRSLKFQGNNPFFSSTSDEHPADKMKKMFIWLIVIIVAAIVLPDLLMN